MAQAASSSPDNAPGGLTFIIWLVAFGGIFYFMIIRPQMTAKKDQDNLIASAKIGDKIVTTGGIVGTISNVKDKSVMVKVADNVKIEILKTHLASVTKPETASTES